jgi:Raf kinase inhibitor-like YbhB/YbcL family protein
MLASVFQRSLAVVFLVAGIAYCCPNAYAAPGVIRGARMNISTPAFSEGQKIPQQFTGDGQNISPSLSWTGAPANTKTFALIVDDPDAPMGTWVHWVAYDIPASVHGLTEGEPTSAQIREGGTQGKSSFGTVGYGGPAPPPGKPHRYFFKLYALDSLLGLKPGASKEDLQQAMKGHVLAEAQTMGMYGR